jgi:hypothetical protein
MVYLFKMLQVLSSLYYEGNDCGFKLDEMFMIW